MTESMTKPWVLEPQAPGCVPVEVVPCVHGYIFRTHLAEGERCPGARVRRVVQ